MRFFLDNNLSHLLAHALHALSQSEPRPIDVIHLTDRFQGPTEDAVWIRTLAAEGNWVVISQDRFGKNDLEREALRQSHLTVFALDRQWAQMRHWPKAQNLVRWWPAIMDQAARVQPGAAFRVPWRFSSQGQFEQIRI